MPRIADRYAGAAVGLSAAAGVLAAYLLTLATGVVWAGAGIDSGDLVAAVAVGGVPHPTGYPTLSCCLDWRCGPSRWVTWRCG